MRLDHHGSARRETANDPTLFRMNNSRLYRWLSPDPLAGDISNPQSLNRYAYVLNNPTNLIDPPGLQCTPGAPGYEDDCPSQPGPGNLPPTMNCFYDPWAGGIACWPAGGGTTAGINCMTIGGCIPRPPTRPTSGGNPP